MDKAFELAPDTLGDVPLKLIDADPEQPRKDFDEEYIDQLAESIKADGLIQPIVLRTNPEQPGRFYIVAGENRWRASKKAKLKSIKAVLREVDGLSKLIVQLKENHQRKDLNPMEWALALKTMNKRYGIKQADIEKTLKESGVGNFGRPYISNMIRLLELPEWAQSLIRNNAITASHGKFLLPAMASEKVMEAMRVKFEEDNWRPSTTELQSSIYYSFVRHHKDLTSYQTDFDYRVECVDSGCQKMRKISHHTDSTFCLDEACHAMKQAEEKKKEEGRTKERSERERSNSEVAETREIVFDNQNRVDVGQYDLRFHRDYISIDCADFDIGACDGCEHRHISLIGGDTDNQREYDSCFLLSCFREKDDAAARATRLTRNYIIDATAKRVRDDSELAVKVLAWIAADVPEVSTGENGESIAYGFYSILDEETTDEVLFKAGLTHIGQFIGARADQLAELGAYAVTRLNNSDTLQLAAALKITIEDYSIDDHYLAVHTEEELRKIIDAVDWHGTALADLQQAENDNKLDSFLKKHAAVIGVPAEIRFAYQQLTKADDDE